MPAYFSDQTQDAQGAREHKAFARIQTAGPWGYVPLSYRGKAGVFAAQLEVGDMLPMNPEAYGAPRACSDGLIYFPHPRPLPQELLAKRAAVRGFDVTLMRGVQLTIPLVDLAPKFVSFTGGPPEAATELEAAMVALWARFREMNAAEADAKANGTPVNPTKIVRLTDPDVLRVIALGIQQNYRVTDESLEDQRWITTADLQPLLSALEGADPKSDAAGKPTSPSQPAA